MMFLLCVDVLLPPRSDHPTPRVTRAPALSLDFEVEAALLGRVVGALVEAVEARGRPWFPAGFVDPGLDEEAHREEPLAEVPLVERSQEDRFVQALEVAQRELQRQ